MDIVRHYCPFAPFISHRYFDIRCKIANGDIDMGNICNEF